MLDQGSLPLVAYADSDIIQPKRLFLEISIIRDELFFSFLPVLQCDFERERSSLKSGASALSSLRRDVSFADRAPARQSPGRWTRAFGAVTTHYSRLTTHHSPLTIFQPGHCFLDPGFHGPLGRWFLLVCLGDSRYPPAA